MKAQLIESILKHAEYFLLQMDSFYPFGHIVTSNNEVKPVQAWLGNNHPASQEIIDFLDKSFYIQFQKKEIILSAICIDIFINTENNGHETKQDAIEIRLSSDVCSEIIRFLYRKNPNNDKIDFQKYSDTYEAN